MADLSGINRKKVFEDTIWLQYLGCGGCGVGELKPFVLSDVKELCLHSQAGTEDFMGEQGLCHNAASCICLSSHFALPPAEGSPTCKLCNLKLFGEDARSSGSTFKSDIFEKDKLFDQFWLYYCFCTGYSVHKPMATGQFIAAQQKEFCCAGATVLEMPLVEGVACSQLGTTLCIWQECQMPPAKGNPMVACCSWKLVKEHGDADSNPPGKPQQLVVM